MKRKISILLALSFTLLFAGCEKKQNNIDDDYALKDYSTQYTEEQHVERITARTEEIFAEEIANGELIDYSVEIVYSIYQALPTFFLVELEYAKEWEVRYENPNNGENEEDFSYYQTRNKHFLGLIAWDEYYATLAGYPYNDHVTDGTDVKKAFMDGKSAYALSDYPNNKKYYGGRYQGVGVDNGIYLIATSECLDYKLNSHEFHTHTENCEKTYLETVITEDIYERFAFIDYIAQYPYGGFLGEKGIYKRQATAKKQCNHSEFSTYHTEERHIDYITASTMEIFEKELQNGELVDIQVDIVYSINGNNPQFFVVELEFANEWEWFYTKPEYMREPNEPKEVYYQTKYKHLIGLIADDVYYNCLSGYYVESDSKASFMDGRSPYSLSGYSDSKKYLGGYYRGVETNEGILLFDNADCWDGSRQAHFPHKPYEFCSSQSDYQKEILTATTDKNQIRFNAFPHADKNCFSKSKEYRVRS